MANSSRTRDSASSRNEVFIAWKNSLAGGLARRVGMPDGAAGKPAG
jgi:hypothetical protein